MTLYYFLFFQFIERYLFILLFSLIILCIIIKF